jgi:hypothetical protein
MNSFTFIDKKGIVLFHGNNISFSIGEKVYIEVYNEWYKVISIITRISRYNTVHSTILVERVKNDL